MHFHKYSANIKVNKHISASGRHKQRPEIPKALTPICTPLKKHNEYGALPSSAKACLPCKAMIYG
jgi:hypothetical protein